MMHIYKPGLSIAPIAPAEDRGIWTLGVVLTIALSALAGWLFGAVLLRFAVWVVVVLLVAGGLM